MKSGGGRSGREVWREGERRGREEKRKGSRERNIEGSYVRIQNYE
jgi:hypothetical protein